MVVVSRVFESPYQEDLNENVKEVLRTEFGLVPANGPDAEVVMVWEDEQGIGRYRVHVSSRSKEGGVPYNCVAFNYWISNRKFCREVLERDPMKAAYERVLSLTTHLQERLDLRVEYDLEQLTRKMEKERKRIIKKYGSL
ncbi:MAG: hypothetical protein WCV90_02715 [Candidatus Woesearchaeota archaeon]